MDLFQACCSLIQTTIDGGSDSESPTHNRTQSSDETSQRLALFLAVNDLHRRDIVGEKHAGDTAPCMLALLMTIGSIVSASETTLVACHRVLMCLDCTALAVSITAEANVVSATSVHAVRRPAEWKIRSRDYLDKVHEVVSRIASHLRSVIKWVQVVVAVRRVLLAKLVLEVFWKLRPKAEVMDGVSERVSLLEIWRIPVVGEIVHMHVPIAVTAPWSNVKVADDLVHPNATFNAAPFLSLLVQPLTVVLALALLNRVSLLATKLPCSGSIRVPHFVAGITAAWLLGIGWRICTIACAAV